MKKNLLQRVIIIAIVTLLALAAIFWPGRKPTARDFTAAGVNNILRQNINLGLDLRGGSELVMQVQVQDYLRRVTENVYNGVQTAARDLGYEIKEARPEIGGDTYRVVVVAGDASKVQEMRDQLPRRVNDFSPNDWTSSASGNTITWEMTDRAKTDLGLRATQDALKIIDTRINALGVTEPTLQTHGSANSHQILLQMPGIDDPERIKALLVGESRLELMKVVGATNPSPITTYPTEDAAKASLGGTVRRTAACSPTTSATSRRPRAARTSSRGSPPPGSSSSRRRSLTAANCARPRPCRGTPRAATTPTRSTSR